MDHFHYEGRDWGSKKIIPKKSCSRLCYQYLVLIAASKVEKIKRLFTFVTILIVMSFRAFLHSLISQDHPTTV